jgi:NADH dehydrogenase/NADH:ubiquinone oxidoreductase subunit G
MTPISITADDKIIEVHAGANLLSACLANGIYIPHLCYLETMKPVSASCRLCFVEIEGGRGPVPACTISIVEPISVKTDTPAVRRLQKAGLRLLLSVHHIDCKNCPANRNCELQRIAKFLKIGLNPGKLERRLKEPAVESLHPCLEYYPNRCVLCGKCLHVCRSKHRKAVLTFIRRGFDTAIGYYSASADTDLSYPGCRDCIDVCPVAALQLKSD